MNELSVYDQVMELLIENGVEDVRKKFDLIFGRDLEKSLSFDSINFEDNVGYGCKNKNYYNHFNGENHEEVRFYHEPTDHEDAGDPNFKKLFAEIYTHTALKRNVRDAYLTEGKSEYNSVVAFDKKLKSWRNRALPNCKYIVLDARYEKVKANDSEVNAAVLLAVCILENGQRSILGVSVSLKEAEEYWRDFLVSLKKRGVHDVELVVGDDHEGLDSALKFVYPNVIKQRCQTHLQRNARLYVAQREMRKEVAEDIHLIFNADDGVEACCLLEQIVDKYKQKAGKLAEWLRVNIPEGLAVFNPTLELNEKERQLLRSTNCLDHLKRETKRRIRMASLFPNQTALLNSITELLIEENEKWQTSSLYEDVDCMYSCRN